MVTHLLLTRAHLLLDWRESKHGLRRLVELVAVGVVAALARVRGPPGRAEGGAGGGPSDGPPPTPSRKARRILFLLNQRVT